jgi:hypothetical protein
MNTTHVEHDALAALRAELTMAAGRRIRRRRGRRRTVIVVALIALLLAATAATAALIRSSTGVPAVDKLLEIDNYGGSALPAGRGTRPIKVRMGDGVYQIVAYLNRRGEVSIASAQRHNGGVRGTSSGGGYRPADLARRLRRHGTMLAGSSHGPEQRVFWGYADGAVRSVRVKGTPGEWLVKMSPPWRPHARGARPIRLLVVIDERDIDVGDDGVQMDEGERLMTPMPKLEAVYAK